MTTAHHYLGIVPARAGSTRIPGKNLIALGGLPLIDHTLIAAGEARRLTALVVSTDSDAIAARARARAVTVPELRPAAIAGDRSPIVAALQHALAAYERSGERTHAVVLLQPTSPFRSAADIDAAIDLFERSDADTVTAVRAAHDHPYWTWRGDGEALTPFFSRREMSMDRQDLPPAYSENGAIYVMRRALVEAGNLYGARVVPYLMDEIASVDIDTPRDLAWAEYLLASGKVVARS